MTIAIVGRTGSGKSYTAKGMIEGDLTFGGRLCVLDPTGVWWGLRLSADGRSGGFSVVILGGAHADVPISADQGAQIGEMIAAEAIEQSVIDLSEMSGAEQTRFLTAFLEAVYTRNRSPLRLVFDEADIMAPQNPLPEQRRLQGATNKIVRRGRVKGFRPILITQRPAVIDKSVLSQIETLVAMRLTSPQDRKAIEEWVKGNADGAEAKAVIDSLASLDTGEGWLWSPGEDLLKRQRFPAIQTFDSGRTPEPGDEPREVKPLSRAGLEAIRAALAPPASEPATPLARSKKGVPAPAPEIDVSAIERRAYERGFSAGKAVIVEAMIGHARQIGHDVEHAIADRVRQAASTLRVDAAAPPALPARQTEPKPAGDAGAPAPRTTIFFNSAARKMLAVLDTNPPVRRTWAQIATLAGLKARGGHFNAGKKALGPLISVDGDLVSIVKPSSRAGPAVTDPAALVEMWAGALTGAAPKILRMLFEVGGAFSRFAIADRLGMLPRGGHWNAAWKELRDNGIVTVAGDDAALTDLFQP